MSNFEVIGHLKHRSRISWSSPTKRKKKFSSWKSRNSPNARVSSFESKSPLNGRFKFNPHSPVCLALREAKLTGNRTPLKRLSSSSSSSSSRHTPKRRLKFPAGTTFSDHQNLNKMSSNTTAHGHKKDNGDCRHGGTSESSGFFSDLSLSFGCAVDPLSRDKTSRNKPIIIDRGYHSRDLDAEMSNLSIDATDCHIQSKFSFEGSNAQVMEEACEESHYTLDDLRVKDAKVIFKTEKNIGVLLPLQGYQVPSSIKRSGSGSSVEMEKLISIDTMDVNLEENFLKEGLRIFQVSPIISIQPCVVKFCTLYPAIVHIPMNLEPSAGDEVYCLHSSAPIMNQASESFASVAGWSADGVVGKCSIKNGIFTLETFQLGLFVLVIRPKCAYTSVTKDIKANEGGELVVSGFSNVKVSFPKNATNKDIIRASAKIYFDTEESLSDFLTRGGNAGKEPWSLATPIIQLDPHGIQFPNDPVLITLPVPDYDQIKSLWGDKAQLTIWHSNTHSSEPSQWERLNVEHLISDYQHNGKTLYAVTFPVYHFSSFKGMWNVLLEELYAVTVGMTYFFVSFVMNCQANMQEYPVSPSTEATIVSEVEDSNSIKPVGGGHGFGLEVLVYQGDQPSSQLRTYQHKVGQGIPKLVKPGNLRIRLTSKYFEPDEHAGEETLEEEASFCGRDTGAQFLCRFKPGVAIEKGPFGKVLISRHLRSPQKGQTIFKFNLQKHGNEGDVGWWVAKSVEEDRLMMHFTTFANCMDVTEDANWKLFALELGMSKEEIHAVKLKSDGQPFQTIVNQFRESGGSVENLFDALYRYSRILDISGSYVGGGRSFTKGVSGSPCQLVDTRSNVRRWSAESSSHRKSVESVNSKRSSNSSLRSTLTLSKRQRLSRDLESSSEFYSMDANEDSISDADDIIDAEPSDSLIRNNHTRLEDLWEIARHIESSNWRCLGRTLKLRESILFEIAKEKGEHKIRECTFQMLCEWQSIFPSDCTIGNLYAALQKEGMNAAAEKFVKNVVYNL